MEQFKIIARTVFLLFFCGLVLLPFFWMGLTALKDPSLSLSFRLFPEWSTFQQAGFWKTMSDFYNLNNFSRILSDPHFPFGLFFLNSFVVASLSGLLTVLLCLWAGYAFARKNFWGKERLFQVLMSSLLVPGMIYMVPQFALVYQLGWMNSYQGMIVPHLANVFGLYLVRQHIEQLPKSLFESASMEGASDFQMLFWVVIPLSWPVLLTLFLTIFTNQWSNFLWQLIINSPDSAYRTLPVGLALFKGQYQLYWGAVMAGACLSVVPMILIFLFTQRFFIEGMTKGAIKG
ncbi:MAG: carbohydrate ABC transporter permease [Planctomycetota bacterium]